MYIWTGLVFNKNDEMKIRQICKEVNCDYNVSEQSFTLPQHISLKTSFYAENYIEIINYMKSILKDNLSNIIFLTSYIIDLCFLLRRISNIRL